MPFYQVQHKQDIIRHFTPNWFAVTMGTGVVALILPEFSFFPVLMWQLATWLWQLNSLLFSMFAVLYILRWIMYPKEAQEIFQHPSMSLFLGTIPMGLATVLNGLLKFGLPIYGDIAIQVAHVLWYVDVVLAIGIGILVPFCMYSRQQHQLQTMTAMWLLPIVACEVAAASGGLLLIHLPANQEALAVFFMSYMLWGMSVLPAMAILTILLLRLALHRLPTKELAMSSWLALGPIGTGALALLVLGTQAPQLLPTFNLTALALFCQNLGLLGAVILLGFGFWWLCIAALTTLSHVKQGIPFNLGWWGLTFPLGVFCLAMFQLGHQLNIQFILSVGLFFASILVLLWFLVMLKTVQGIYAGYLFFSPCLQSLLERQQKKL